MKPLLRVVLIIDALLLLAFGVLFVLTPWKGLYDALQLVQVEPAMVGQAFGIALLGLAWLSFHAAVNGAHDLRRRARRRPCELADRRADGGLADRPCTGPS